MKRNYDHLSDAEKYRISLEYSDPAAKERYGIPTPTVRHWRRIYKSREAKEHVLPEFLDLKISSLSWREALTTIRQEQDLVSKADVGQHEATVKISTDDPIILVPTADWHLGSLGTDYGAFERDLDFILQTPNLYLIDVGDGIDNFHNFKSAEAVLGQAIPPKVQRLLLEKILEELVNQGKLIARTWSNHMEGFDERVFGGSIDRINELCPYLKDDGRLHLTVGETTYHIMAKHIFSGKSIYHVNQGAKRSARLEWPDADILISAHTHDGPEFDFFNYNGRKVLAAKVGTYKVNDSHARRYRGPSPTNSTQGIVLFPEMRKIVPFDDVRDAVRYKASFTQVQP